MSDVMKPFIFDEKKRNSEPKAAIQANEAPQRKNTDFNQSFFDNMKKIELDEWASSEFGIDLDRRQTKDDMIEEFWQEYLG